MTPGWDDDRKKKHASNLKKRWKTNSAYRTTMIRSANDPANKKKRMKAVQLRNPNFLKYGGLDKSAVSHFAGCHGRVRYGKVPSIQWPRTREGYVAFCKEIGPKPKTNEKWSVGRKNHNKGYVKGNIMWQLYGDNVREMRARISR